MQRRQRTILLRKPGIIYEYNEIFEKYEIVVVAAE